MIELTLSQLLREKTKENPSQEFMVYSDRGNAINSDLDFYTLA